MPAASGVDGPMLVTTSDNMLLTPGAVLATLGPLTAGRRACRLALATEGSVRAAHPDGQRRFYRFSDDAYSNCNLYALGGIGAARVAESFRSGGQFAGSRCGMIVALGADQPGLLLMQRLSLRGALRRLGRRFRLTVEPVILADGAHAIDVDNARTYACAELRRGEAVAALAAQVASTAAGVRLVPATVTRRRRSQARSATPCIPPVPRCFWVPDKPGDDDQREVGSARPVRQHRTAPTPLRSAAWMSVIRADRRPLPLSRAAMTDWL